MTNEEKPLNCTCRFPAIRVRRPICHEDGCPVQVEYERFVRERNALRLAKQDADERSAGIAAYEAFVSTLDRHLADWEYFLAGWKARRKHDDEEMVKHL